METNSTRLYDALEVCLAAMGTGVDLDACLKLYPDLADELRPALITAQRARRLGSATIPTPGMKLSRARLLARAEELRAARRPYFLRVAPRLAMGAVALVLVLVLSLNGLAVVSAKSLPGDALYPVKLAAENVSLKLASNTETRLKMEEDYQQRRAEEVRSLLLQSRIHKVSFEGIVDEAKPGRLVVQGIPVALDANTVVKGEILPGRLVEVEGSTQPGGWIEAHELHLRFYEYIGQLQAIQPGLWTIGDTQFKILRETHLDPTLRAGEQVLVLVYSGDDGSLYAQAILRVPETLVEGQESFEPFDIEFTGTVQAISGDSLVIDGKTVQLTGETEIKGDFTIGTLLKVHAAVSPDGSLTAREVEVANSQGGQGEGNAQSGNQGQSGEEGQSGESEQSGDEDQSGGEDKSGEDDQSVNEDQSGDEDKSGGDDQSDDKKSGDEGSGGEDHSGSGGDSGHDDDSGSGEDGSGSDQSGSGGSDDHSGGDHSGSEPEDNSGSGSGEGD